MKTVKIEPSVVHSKWCVRCYPSQYEGASFIYKGNSLCEDCFKYMIKLGQDNPRNWWYNDGTGRKGDKK